MNSNSAAKKIRQFLHCTCVHRKIVGHSNSPGSSKISNVNDDGFRQRQLASRVVAWKVVEAVDQRRSEDVRQLLPVHCAHALQEKQTNEETNNFSSRWCLPNKRSVYTYVLKTHKSLFFVARVCRVS